MTRRPHCRWPVLPQIVVLLVVMFAAFVGVASAEDPPYRPAVDEFAPLEKAHAYHGELIFLDHANRRGSLRVAGDGMFFRNDPHPFAMLPYGIVRYHGATADLRDIPLGTVMHAYGFLPPDPRISAVPVLPVDNKKKDANHNRGAGIFPAENHILLIEDEPSHCLREGKIWRLESVTLANQRGTVIAARVPRNDENSAIGGSAEGDAEEDSAADPQTLTFDAATRFWRGRECLSVADLVADGTWPSEGTQSLDGQSAFLGLTWKPTPNGVFTRFHISDIWLDDTAMQRAGQNQTETHKAFIRSRWMPARIDAVEYGEFGHATIVATLFGGMDSSLYADFKVGQSALMNSVENTLKHTHGAYGPAHMASRGPILDVVRSDGEIPLGSSGIQIRFATDLIIEGIRPGRVVRVCPGSWPQVNLPREEYLDGGSANLDARFPTPDIFPKY